jgi:3',5'-cyclic AMP phosphodiesterase CpdA
VRIVQVSDTHLSRTHQDFADNNKRIAASIAALKPDLIIHTGDVSMNGAGDARDFDVSRGWIDALPAETLLVPGNHDVGDLPTIKAEQPVDARRLEIWQDAFGMDRWVRDIPGWRLIGLDAMLCGTGLAEEESQFEWLAQAVDTCWPIALFMHKPLCIDDTLEGPCGYWTVAPEPRRRLLALIDAAPVRMIATGHLHIHRQARIAGITHVWGPAASFVCGASQEDLGGGRRLGVIEHTFSNDGVESRYLRADGLEDLQIEPVIDRIYPKSAVAQLQ